MTPEECENMRLWAVTMEQARDLDPIIREALRPVFERLKSDAPNTAAAFAVAMICRALRMLATVDGPPSQDMLIATCYAAMKEVTERSEHP